MKNTFKNIISKVAFTSAAFLFGLTAFGQDGSVKIGKSVTQTPDENGVYYISLEAYVTGSITVTQSPAPADIVLVLDYSNSMRDDIGTLRSTVKDFVDIIKTSDGNIKEEDKDIIDGEKVGHRIAFVLYSGQVYTPGMNYGSVSVPSTLNLNEFLAATKLTTSGTSNVYYNGATTSLISPGISTGTASGDAMEKAEAIFNGQTYDADSERSKIVVFFTDGEPGNREDQWGSATTGRTAEATQCIKAAYNIKNTYGATVYSVGLMTKPNTGTQVTAFLSYTSSDYTDVQAMPTTAPSGGWPNVSDDKSIIVTDASQLANVFSSIATSAGGNYSASSQSSVLIDVVTSSFAIPTDTDLGTVQVYKDTCTQQSKTGIISFATTGGTGSVSITDDVDLVTDPTTGEVTVTGFDYGANWCGWNDEANNGAGGPHGNRLVLLIPIVVRDDAVGGPHVNTNTSDSKLIIKDSVGTVISTSYFPRPYLKLPVSLWIQKTGLLEDDSAVFNLRRTPYLGPDVDYTASTIEWEDWGEKIVCNIHTMDENGIVKVSGLSPDYVYKIYEDAWGALGYIYEDDDTQYSVGESVENPFIFNNTPKKTVFDEATVRNVFKKKENTSTGSEE